jgi:hypothetical protein
MGKPPRFDARALSRVLGERAPAAFSREDRIRLLGEAFKALNEGRLPAPEARLFLAGGLLSWLRDHGNLTRDYWRVDGPRGSHRTPSATWKRIAKPHTSSWKHRESQPNPRFVAMCRTLAPSREFRASAHLGTLRPR